MASSLQSRRKFAELPPEIISQIISHAPSANFLRNLSLTSRSLHEIVESDGWNAFVAHRFPSMSVPPYWRDAAHALTTLSRNFDRRAFFAQDNGPDLGPTHRTFLRKLPSGEVSTQWKRPQSQTMGYQPVIDSHEEWIGNSWAERREIVAWGAGAEVVVQIIQRGPSDLLPSGDESAQDRAYNQSCDKTGHSRRQWLTHRRPEDLEGRNDITSINLVNLSTPPSTAEAPRPEGAVDVIVGRASGGLEMLRLGNNGSQCIKAFDTRKLAVRSADVNFTSKPLVGACIGEEKIALYHVAGGEQQVSPVSESSDPSERDRGSRAWSVRFLCDDKLAVGRGISSRIVDVYSVRPEGLSAQPIRSFGSRRHDDREVQTSAYPIVPVPASTTSQEAVGDTFFSGGHDGIIRLHDMRSPLDCQTTIADWSDRCAIFSLATVGRERLIAGAASHSLLKVFDLRMTGGRSYSYHSLTEPFDLGSQNPPAIPGAKIEYSGWNAYTRIFNRNGMRRTSTKSPVYSLSRPSPSSTSLYVGTENTVSHFNFTSMSDAHPDPLFRHSIIKMSNGRIDSRQTWNPRNIVSPLKIYERTGDVEFSLLKQKFGEHALRLMERERNGNLLGNRMFQSMDGLEGYDESLQLIT